MTSRPRYVQIPGSLEILTAQYAEQQFAPHFHDTYTFGVITSGACHFVRGGTPYVARAGDLFVIHPYELHTGGTNRQNLEYRAVYIAPEWLGQFPKDGHVPYFPSAVYSHRLGRALRDAIDRQEPQPIEALLVEITKTCARGMRRFVHPQEEGSRIGRACRLLNDNWAADISTDAR